MEINLKLHGLSPFLPHGRPAIVPAEALDDLSECSDQAPSYYPRGLQMYLTVEYNVAASLVLVRLGV